MPKRSNEKQQIIEMLKTLTASEGWVVTASKFLLDRRLDEQTEVDVVAEHVADGQLFTQCFEVVGRGRKATLAWVREMIAKHDTLPTDRLFLVSWSGFVANAAKEAAAFPWVKLLVPAAVTPRSVEGVAVFVEEVTMTLRDYCIITSADSGELRTLELLADSMVVDSGDAAIASPLEFTKSLLRNRTLGDRAMETAHNDPMRRDASGFDATVDLQHLGLRVQSKAANRSDALLGVQVRGAFSWKQQHVPMTVREFGASLFKHGRAKILGREHLIVAALDEEHRALKTLAQLEKR